MDGTAGLGSLVQIIDPQHRHGEDPDYLYVVRGQHLTRRQLERAMRVDGLAAELAMGVGSTTDAVGVSENWSASSIPSPGTPPPSARRSAPSRVPRTRR
jgi:hypothetical protein